MKSRLRPSRLRTPLARGHGLGVAVGMALTYALALLVLLTPKASPEPVVNLYEESDSPKSDFASIGDLLPESDPQTFIIACNFGIETVHLPEFPEVEIEYFLCSPFRSNGLIGPGYGRILQLIEQELSQSPKSYTRHLSKCTPQET